MSNRWIRDIIKKAAQALRAVLVLLCIAASIFLIFFVFISFHPDTMIQMLEENGGDHEGYFAGRIIYTHLVMMLLFYSYTISTNYIFLQEEYAWAIILHACLCLFLFISILDFSLFTYVGFRSSAFSTGHKRKACKATKTKRYIPCGCMPSEQHIYPPQQLTQSQPGRCLFAGDAQRFPTTQLPDEYHFGAEIGM